MFRVTVLGHQGWVLCTPRANVLVDPLLTEGFGHGGLLGRVYPPRRLDLAGFPALDAVIVTHEHDDHFDIPSLHRIERSVPIYLSARSSVAAFDVLGHMGFEVHRLGAGQELRIGDLRYRTVPADHGAGDQGDEWDVFPFLAYDEAGHGSLLSTVDVGMPRGLLAQVRQLAPRPGLWAYANNVTSARYQELSPAGPALPGDGDALARVAVRRCAEVAQGWGEPLAAVVTGGGWSFGGARAWIDRHAFPLSGARIEAALRREHPDRTVVVPSPGQTLVVRDGRLQPVETCGFVEALPRSRWPDREYAGDGARLTEYAPACGRRSLGPQGREELLHEVQDLARYLYGTPLFVQLASLPTGPVDGREPAVALVLRTEAEPLVLRYEPQGCRFAVHGGPDPRRALMSGLECWATDLLALLRGELAPSALCFAGRMRAWNADARRLWVSPHVLWRFGHPLRRPAATARLYRRLLGAQPDVVPRVRGRVP